MLRRKTAFVVQIVNTKVTFRRELLRQQWRRKALKQTRIAICLHWWQYSATNLHFDGEALINSSKSQAQTDNMGNPPSLLIVLVLQHGYLPENVMHMGKLGHDATLYSRKGATLLKNYTLEPVLFFWLQGRKRPNRKQKLTQKLAGCKQWLRVH